MGAQGRAARGRVCTWARRAASHPTPWNMAVQGDALLPRQREVPAASTALFPLAALFRETLPEGTTVPRVRVVDVGAMLLGEADDVWTPLLRQGLCESVVGFEPNAEE